MIMVKTLMVLLMIDSLKRVKAQLEVHEAHPLKSSALNIVNYILTKSPPVRPFGPVPAIKLKEQCSQAEIFEDLKEHAGFHGQLTQDCDDQWSFFDFVKGWGAMADHADPLEIDHNPLIAFNVASKSKSGFRKCIDELPTEIQAEGIFCKSREDESPMLYGVVTPAPCISPPHSDNSGSGHIILQSYKTKLIIWWDVTDEILEMYSRLHCRNIVGNPTLTAIKTWGEFHWVVLKPGEYLCMDPGQIHCVVSSVNSAVSGWSFVSSEWLKSGNLQKIMSWEMELIEKRLDYVSRTKVSDEHLSEAVAGVEQDLKLWEHWFKKGDLSVGLKRDLKVLMRDMNAKWKPIREKMKQ